MDYRRIIKTSAVIGALSSGVILFTTFYPIISYEIKYKGKFPLLTGASPEEANLAGPIDYRNPKNWFVGDEYEIKEAPKISFYSISVPKLRIKDAVVEIGGEDLEKSLIHYPGTSLPGRKGNAVIFGHSSLPQYYDPKNYYTIFSLLPTMEVGNSFSVNFDGVTYTYKIESMFEVLPTDIQVLDQSFKSSYVTLITCVPPGDILKPRRLVVRAKLVKPG